MGIFLDKIVEKTKDITSVRCTVTKKQWVCEADAFCYTYVFMLGYIYY